MSSMVLEGIPSELGVGRMMNSIAIHLVGIGHRSTLVGRQREWRGYHEMVVVIK